MFTGSGMPMRFADLDGSMIDVYQAATQMTDESGQSYPDEHRLAAQQGARPPGLLRRVHGEHAHRQRLERGLGRDRRLGPVTRASRSSPLSRCCNGSMDATSRPSTGSPGAGTRLSFSVSHAAGANGLRGMVPTTSSVGALTTVKRNGVQIPTTTQTIKGREYAFFDADAGNYEATYAVDNTAPTISNVAASAHGDGTADITWDTDEASTSTVDYGTNPNDLNQNQSSPGLVTSHSVQLTGLAPNTTYHYRVTSADAVTPVPNSSTSPEPPASASFTTPSATFTDTTVSDFSAGTPDANTYVSETGNGEVDPEADRGPGVLGRSRAARRLASCTWPASPLRSCSPRRRHASRAAACTSTAASPAPTPPSAPATRSSSPPPSAPPPSSTSASRTTSPAPGRCSAPGGSTSQLYASTNTGGSPDRHPGRPPASTSAPRTSTGSSGTRARSSTTSTATWSHTDSADLRRQPRTSLASDFNSGGPEPLGRLAAPEPLPGLGHLPLARLRRRPGGRLGRAQLERQRAAGHQRADQRPHRRHPHPRRDLERLHPDQQQRRRHPRQLPLRPVPGRAWFERSEPDAHPRATSRSPTRRGPTRRRRRSPQSTPAPNATNVPRNTNVDVQFSEAMNPATIDDTRPSGCESRGQAATCRRA